MKTVATPPPRSTRNRSSSLLKVFKKGTNVSGTSTAPNTPDDEGGVSVLANEYDPSRDISALTDSQVHSPFRSGFVCGGDDTRAVAFDMMSGGGTNFSPPNSPGGSSKMYTRSLMSFEEKKESDDVVSKTLAYLDEFCAVPKVADYQPASIVSSTNRKTNRLQHPEWVQEPSLDDDDDTTTNPSIPSASTSSADHHSHSYQTTTVASNSIILGRTAPGAIPNSPSQDHENFEVVLDPSSIANEESTAPKRRWPFSSSKRGDLVEVEHHQTQQMQQEHPPRSQESKPRESADQAVDPVVGSDDKHETLRPGGEDGAVKDKKEGSASGNGGTKKKKTLVKRLWKSYTHLPGRAASKQVPASQAPQQQHLAEVDNENAVARSLDLEGQDFLHQQGSHTLDFEPIAEENEDDADESHEESGNSRGNADKKEESAASMANAWNSIFASITAAFDPDAGVSSDVVDTSNEVSTSGVDVLSEEESRDIESRRMSEEAASKRNDATKAAQVASNEDVPRKAWGPFKAIKKSAKALVKPKKARGGKENLQHQRKAATKAAPEPIAVPRSLANVAAAAGIAQKPKVQWKAVIDPNSGKTYYYHRKTRETTWTKPAEYQQYELDLKKWMEASALDAEAAPTRSNSAIEHPGASPQNASQDSPSSRSATWPSVTSKETDVSKPSEVKRSSTPAGGSTLANALSDSRPTKSDKKLLSNDEESFEAEYTNPMISTQAPIEVIPLATPAPTKPDVSWETRKEVERLVKSLPPADTVKSVDQLMKEYKGREGILLDELRAKLESQPFDEPMDSDEPAHAHPPRSPHRFGSRTMTHISKASANTRSSALTDRTEKVKNTGRDRFSVVPVAETFSTSTSLSSKHDEEMNYGGRLSPTRRIPSRVPVPRERQLMVEELTDARLSAESYEGNGEKRGRIVRGRARDRVVASDTYDGDIETEEEGVTSAYESDAYGTDSISALSENDTDFLNRKDNFEQARRRALDDAIEREDWDLAAALSEGMRAANLPGGYERAHSSWNQSELDKFIANNDWNAVKSYIARMREMTKKAQKEAVIESPRKVQPSNVSRASSANKGIGARSQLQHKELLSESSWTSDSRSSYESDDSDSEL